MSRLQMFVALILAAIVWLTSWVLLRDLEPSAPDRFLGPSRPDYELANFELSAFDEQGNISFRASAPRLLHDDRVEGMAVTEPQFLLYGKNGRRWRAEGKTAWIDTRNKRIDLETEVAIRSDTEEASETWSLTTDRLVAHTDTRRVETDSAVEVRQPGSLLRGRGLSANLNDKSFELKADVHGQFVPQR